MVGCNITPLGQAGSNEKTKAPKQDKSSEVTKTDELGKKLDDVFAKSPSGFNGSVLIATNGKVVLEKGYGMADVKNKIPNGKDTTFAIFSVTKQFTSMAIMMLEERGLLSVNDTVSKYIPGFKGGDKITIHNLLSMTSGIGDYLVRNPDYREYSVEELITKVKRAPINFNAGTKFDYSNSNYIILGYIIEKVSGLKYGEFLKRNIFTPLNMSNTAYDPGDKERKNKANGYITIGKYSASEANKLNMSYCYAAGGIYSTVDDLFKWSQALTTEKLVKKSTIDKMFKPNLDGYGYGWQNNNDYIHVISHTGGFSFKGYQSSIGKFLDNNTVVIRLQNENDDHAWDEVVEGYLKVLTDEKIIIKK